MAKMIQVRNVPDSIHRALKAKAALAGKSLSDWILEELEALAVLPSEEELLARLRGANPSANTTSCIRVARRRCEPGATQQGRAVRR